MRKAEENLTDADIFSLLEPSVALWFRTAFKGFTESQRKAIPAILKNKNTLIFSQTGTGKTLAAFTAAINMLFSLSRQGRLEDRVYVVYVSPLRALANDIRKNLLWPLEGIGEFEEDADIRVLVRSGDTPSHKKTLMLKKPPHILITTPETLAIVLNAPLFSRHLHDVSYVIVDEIHALCDSKRGAHLSLSLERLQRISPGMVRIGLSATQAPLEEIARFLAGTRRKADIVSIPPSKDFDAQIVLPSEDMSEPYEVLREKMIDKLCALIAQHKTTIVFTNTRSGTESMIHALRKRGILASEPHHGSMSREERMAVEDRLKRGELSCVVTSTSLELGIDVGSVDLVVQIGSPRSVAKALQRMGRANHAVGGRSKARFIVFDRDELIETSVILQEARRGNIDRVDMPKNCLDVLAQHVVGMALEKEWDVEEAYGLIRQSYTYAGLARRDFEDILLFLSEGNEGVYPRISRSGNLFQAHKGSRMLYLANIGTIPESSSFKVIHQNGFLLGTLSESFVSHLSEGDIFVLGGKCLEFLSAEKEKIFVGDATGKKPTIPSWSGEAMPRSFDLSRAIGKHRREIFEKLEKGKKPCGVAEEYIFQQSFFGKPTDECIFVERYLDRKKQQNLIVHSVFGRRVNEALCFIMSETLRRRGLQFKTSVCDDGFLFLFPCPCDVEIESLFLLPEKHPSLKSTELFKTRFRHVASRSLAIVRNWKGRRLSLRAQKAKGFFLLGSMGEDHPLVRETENEILFSYMDYERACSILEEVSEKRIALQIAPVSDAPSPFALNILLSSKSDLVMVEDKGSLLSELQEKIHRCLFEKTAPLFSDSEIADYFAKGEIMGETLEEKIVSLLSRHGPCTMGQMEERLSCMTGEIEPILSNSDQIVSGFFVEGESPQYMLLRDRQNLLKKHGFSEEDLFRLLARKHFHGFRDAGEVFTRYGVVGSLKAVFDRAGFSECKVVSARIGGKRYFLRQEDLPLYISAYRMEELSRKERLALEGIGEGMAMDEFLRREGGRQVLYELERNLYVIRKEGRLVPCPAEPTDRGNAREDVLKKYLSSCGPATLETMREFCGFSHGEISDILERIGARKLRIIGTFPYDVFCLGEDEEALKNIPHFSDRLRIIDARDPHAEKVKYEMAQRYPYGCSPIIKDGRLAGALDHETSDGVLLINEVYGPKEDVLQAAGEIYNLFRFSRRKNVRSVRLKSLYGRDPSDFQTALEGAGFVFEKGRLLFCERKEISPEDSGFMLLKKGCFGTPSGKEAAYGMISRHLFMTEEGCALRIKDFSPSVLKELVYERRICVMELSGKKIMVADRNVPLINFLTQKEALTDEEGQFLDTFPNPQIKRGYEKIFEKLRRNNYLVCLSEYERNAFGVEANHDAIISLIIATSPPLTIEEVRNVTGLPHHTVAECLEKYPSYFSRKQVFTDSLIIGKSEGLMILSEADPLAFIFGKKWERRLGLPKGKKSYILAGGVLAGGILQEEKEGKTVINDLLFFDEYKNHWLELLQKIQNWGDVTIKRINGREVKSASGLF